jgi:hypothetical protein
MLGLLGKRAAAKGWYSGIAADSEDTLAFSRRNGVGSMNEVFPFEEAQAAYEREGAVSGCAEDAVRSRRSNDLRSTSMASPDPLGTQQATKTASTHWWKLAPGFIPRTM